VLTLIVAVTGRTASLLGRTEIALLTKMGVEPVFFRPIVVTFPTTGIVDIAVVATAVKIPE
jgi:hypothetical protein